MGDYIEEALSGPSVFSDESVFDYDWTPPELVDREEAKSFLAEHFKPAITSDNAVAVRVTGRVGTGKTALAKRFCEDLAESAGKRQQRFGYRHVNCRRRNSETKVLHRILTHFDDGFPDRGFSNSEMLDSLRKTISNRGEHLVVVLDEVDELITKAGSDLLYNLVRFREEPPEGGNLSLILLSQDEVFDKLDDATRSSIRRTNHHELEPYDEGQLSAILDQRAELGLQPGALNADAQDLIADIASDDGDARYAIELLHAAGKGADAEGVESITPEHVRTAKAQTRRAVWSDQVLGLPVHKKLALLGLARELVGGNSYATTGEVEDAYNVACESAGEDARGHTQFWTYLKELDGVGLIDTRKSGKGVVGSTTLISMPDVPAERMVEVLEADLGL